jgi:hypothetical protein
MEKITDLVAAADQLDQAALIVPGAPPPEPEPDQATELFGALQLVRDMVAPMLPDDKAAPFKTLWPDSTLQAAATAGAAVCELHGWSLTDALGKYAPYIALLVAVAPPGVATAKLLQAPKTQPAGQGDGQPQQA